MAKMYKLEKTSTKYDRFLNPSFSSTLLDQIYRSIDDGETTPTTFYRERKPTVINKLVTTDRKQNNNKPKTDKVVPVVKKPDSRKFHQRDHEQDALFFSSTSISSDSSSAGFSSDTDSLYGTKSRAMSSFIPPRPKPVRTSASFRFENEKQRNHVFNGYRRSSETKHGTENCGEEAILIKSKSRAVKIYNNLKKVKQPISPGGRLTSFLNSLFHSNNNNEKKSKGSSCCKDERKVASTTCSSASSFSRSCLSKTASFCHRENYKTVRFCGVEEGRVKVKEATRKFLNEYRCNSFKKKNDLVLLKDLCANQNHDEDDDDVASCASSDLFELDHLGVLGDARFCEELPVYGTTRVKC